MADPLFSKNSSQECRFKSYYAHQFNKGNMETKKEINDRRANLIVDKLSDPIQRKIMFAKMWFPLERSIYPTNETEEEWADRKISQLEYEAQKNAERNQKQIERRKRRRKNNENI